MQRKVSTKSAHEKLLQSLQFSQHRVDTLCEATPTPDYQSSEYEDILKNLKRETLDAPFWRNFRKAAPIILCKAIETDKTLRSERDISFMDELLKTKHTVHLMNKKVEDGDADIDAVEYSMVAQMLEYKLTILESLAKQDADEDVFTINLFGSDKAIQVDKKKLQEAVTILDKQVEEKTLIPKKLEFESIPTSLNEEDFLNKAKELIGELQKTAKNTLEKDSFIKLYHYSGEFANMKCKQIRKTMQEKRCDVFNNDPQAYIDQLRATINEEEKTYLQSQKLVFEKVQIEEDVFKKSQQELMSNPQVEIQLFNMGMKMEKPDVAAPEELTPEKTVELVMQSHNYAFDLVKKQYMNVLMQDPMLVPFLVSSVANDWVMVNHKYSEDQFKGALYKHKIFEDKDVARHMKFKQTELMKIAEFSRFQMSAEDSKQMNLEDMLQKDPKQKDL